MLRSIGTKDGTILYHIKYNIIFGRPTISGATGYDQPQCWLISIGLIAKLSCGQICCTSAPTCVVGVFSTTNRREVMNFSLINFVNVSSPKG